MGQFASEAGKKGGEFYTPQEVSKILAKIVTLGKDKIKRLFFGRFFFRGFEEPIPLIIILYPFGSIN